jgi:hypothetical protein
MSNERTETRTSRPTRRRSDSTRAEARSSTEIPSGQIAGRAYELFVERGGTHGHDLDDWLAAESELRSKGRPSFES